MKNENSSSFKDINFVYYIFYHNRRDGTEYEVENDGKALDVSKPIQVKAAKNFFEKAAEATLKVVTAAEKQAMSPSVQSKPVSEKAPMFEKLTKAPLDSKAPANAHLAEDGSFAEESSGTDRHGESTF